MYRTADTVGAPPRRNNRSKRTWVGRAIFRPHRNNTTRIAPVTMPHWPNFYWQDTCRDERWNAACTTTYSWSECGIKNDLSHLFENFKRTYKHHNDHIHWIFSRSYCNTVWSAIGVILSPSLSVCNVVHCGSHGRCTWLKVVPACSQWHVPICPFRHFCCRN